MTQHVGTRISAQVRSHAQKVLKDYSPNNNALADPADKSEMTEQPDNETLTLPKEQTMRTDEPNMGANRLEIGTKTALHGADEECLTTNLNQGQKRYRKAADDSIELTLHENLMRKIKVTQVAVSDLG